jgi:hypothetical protein
MKMSDDLHQRLASLAEHAQHTRTLDDAAAVRGRGDRRRRHQQTASAALGLVVVGALAGGVALAQGRHSPIPAPGATVSAATPGPTAASARPAARPGGVPGDKRKAYVQVDSAQSDDVLSAGVDGHMGAFPIGADAGITEEFHLAGADPYALQTARLTNGKPSCVASKGSTLVTEACDAGADRQAVRLTATGENATHKKLFRIEVGGRAVKMSAAGDLTTVPSAQASTATAFFFVDAGAYQGPSD